MGGSVDKYMDNSKPIGLYYTTVKITNITIINNHVIILKVPAA